MHLADLMEKWRVGSFNPVSSAATFSKQSVRSDGGDRFSKATLNKYLALINDKAKRISWPFPLNEKMKIFAFLWVRIQEGVTFDGLLDNAIKYQLLIYLALSWSISSSTISSGALD